MCESMVEKVARAIIGPHREVPHGCAYTLAELREVRWNQASANEQREALNEARSVLSAMKNKPGRYMDAAYEAHDAYEVAPSPKAWFGLSSAFDAAIDAALNERVAG